MPWVVLLSTCLSLPLPLQEIYVEGKNVVPDVWEVLDKIKEFTGERRERRSIWGGGHLPA
jgi:hypothetical protein